MVNNKNKEKKKTTVKKIDKEISNEKVEKNIEKKDDIYTLLAEHIKEKSTCLEVGCKEGVLGEILKNEKKCKVYGIEEDKKVLKIAQKKDCYQEIYHLKIEEYQNKSYQKFFKESPQYDYIILSNILNHVESPEKLLVEFFSKLKRNGKIIVSLPNSCHIDICKNLINRENILEQNKSLHSFTKQSFLELIQTINETYELSFHATIVDKTVKEPVEYLEKYPNLYKLLNKDKEANVTEYIYEIGKKSKVEESTDEKQRDYFELLEKELQDRVLFSQQLKLQRQENVNLLNQIRIEGEVNQKLTKENETLQKELESILDSKSWKLTKPFRKIVELIQNWRYL